jgi:hypothetical protein
MSIELRLFSQSFFPKPEGHFWELCLACLIARAAMKSGEQVRLSLLFDVPVIGSSPIRL